MLDAESLADYADDAVHNADLPGRMDPGLVTIDRKIRKDAFYWYKANWSDQPFVYITSRRFFQRSSDTIDIKLYSNLDAVDVTLNGVALPPVTATDHIFRYKDVVLRSGENIVKASAKGRTGICRDQVTWMAP